MRHSLYFIASFLLILTTACGPFKYKPVDAKEFPPDPKERVKKNIEEGRGFRIMGSLDKGGKFEFASSNPLWRATLDTLDFMPLVSANYSGGIVITDWYTENNTPAESVKITVRFLTNEIRSDALDVNIFLKKCDANMSNCAISQNNNDLVSELKLNILKKATRYQRDAIDKNKKENPYVGAESKGGDAPKEN
tara:strand:+ start:5373 stop:5951 length:579 start_codon:yes stop_codon:yes gene_type:complete